MVVLGLTLIVIALQVFFSAFLLGVLEIPVHAPALESPDDEGHAAAPRSGCGPCGS